MAAALLFVRSRMMIFVMMTSPFPAVILCMITQTVPQVHCFFARCQAGSARPRHREAMNQAGIIPDRK